MGHSPALILGGAHGSLAVARSLGRRGIDVALLTDHPLTAFSRYVGRHFKWNGPNESNALARLVALAENQGLRGAVLSAGGAKASDIIVSEGYANPDVVQQVRMVCDEYGNCYRSRGGARVVVRDAYNYAPRQR